MSAAAPIHPIAQDVLQYWFEGKTTAERFSMDVGKKWFAAGPDVDEEIRSRFQKYVERFANGEFREWKETPRNNLAAILLADQFTRCIYRSSAKQFELDPIALEFARHLLDTGKVKELEAVERIFAYLPFEHSELLENQKLACALFKELTEETSAKYGADVDVAKFVQASADYAERHREVVERFGRFPHRNDVLGRAPTPAEKKAFEDGTLVSFFNAQK